LARHSEWGGQLPCQAIVCFANTGKEDEATLKFVQDCSENWNVPITWLEYRVDGYAVVDYATASRNGEPFDALTTKKSYLPNPVARFCTQELKVNPIKKFSLVEDDATMVGVRADEPHRIPKMRKRGMLIPLADAGVTQADVQAFWKASSFDLGIDFRDGITPLGNCDLCFLKGSHQVISLILNDSKRAVWWAGQEKKVNATFRSDRPSYASMLEFSEAQRDMFDPNEEAIACFCGD
jgi:3'-phosphoadenosine 5'-phosphosulfate sulfotransferase (PAPS reductase)/FAD synthetase